MAVPCGGGPTISFLPSMRSVLPCFWAMRRRKDASLTLPCNTCSFEPDGASAESPCSCAILVTISLSSTLFSARVIWTSASRCRPSWQTTCSAGGLSRMKRGRSATTSPSKTLPIFEAKPISTLIFTPALNLSPLISSSFGSLKISVHSPNRSTSRSTSTRVRPASSAISSLAPSTLTLQSGISRSSATGGASLSAQGYGKAEFTLRGSNRSRGRSWAAVRSRTFGALEGIGPRRALTVQAPPR